MKLAPEGDWMLGEAFAKRAKHHESIKALWETKWRYPCSIGVYPFHDGKLEDFEPVFKYLIEVLSPTLLRPSAPSFLVL